MKKKWRVQSANEQRHNFVGRVLTFKIFEKKVYCQISMLLVYRFPWITNIIGLYLIRRPKSRLLGKCRNEAQNHPRLVAHDKKKIMLKYLREYPMIPQSAIQNYKILTKCRKHHLKTNRSNFKPSLEEWYSRFTLWKKGPLNKDGAPSNMRLHVTLYGRRLGHTHRR